MTTAHRFAMEKKRYEKRNSRPQQRDRQQPGGRRPAQGRPAQSDDRKAAGRSPKFHADARQERPEAPADRPGRRNHHGKSHSQRPYGPKADKRSSSFKRDAGSRQQQERTPVRKNRPAAAAPKADSGTTRLNKYISNAGICSRREADKLIAAGSISVNGKVVTEMGYQVRPGDVVNYGGETLRSERKRYFLLNKPKGFITTVDDPQCRETVMMLVDGACPERIYPVGRLDRNTTGLLLFTNDGDLARRLTHPSSQVYKIYHVEVDKPVTHNDMKQMLDGIELEDGPIHVDDVQYVQNANDKRVVGVELHSGKNRIVRRIFEHFGYSVHKLDRVVFAGLTKKDLPRGRYRELSEKEVGFLKMV